MIPGFQELDRQFKRAGPSALDTVYYIFMEKGISQAELNKCDLPYIFRMIATYNYYKEQEANELKKSSKK